MPKRSAKRGSDPSRGKGPQLYTLDVLLIEGQMTEKFWDQNPVVSRTIDIRGDQTLEELHYAIFDAFDREEEHMYEYHFGKQPHDRRAKRYVLPEILEDPWGMDEASCEDLTEATLDSLNLHRQQVFFYWFDFGDDWWHKIKVRKIAAEVPKGKYPKVVERVGASPPQYINWDEEDEEEDEGEEEEDEGEDEP